MVNSSKYPDCKMVLVRHWLRELVYIEMSKSLTIQHYDADTSHPACTQLALRAWMCWRTNMRGFLEKKRARRTWWNSEVAALRADIRRLGSGNASTGSAAADALITEWCPAAFVES